MSRPTALLARLIVTALATAALSACGQKGPLFIPSTPAAAQRATLPQTVFGGTAARGGAPASATRAAVPPPLPNLPEIQ
ncbi:MAG TPA: lipoprotein [Ottowia sp.]|nr:lipoprotein [Ottowia sp.]